MIPTIDIGSIFTLGTLIAIIRYIWSMICVAKNWLAATFTIAINSARLWATAFFVGIGLALINAISNALTELVAWLGKLVATSWVWGDLSENFAMVGEFVNVGEISTFCVWAATFTSGVWSLARLAGFAKLALSKFHVMANTFKG